MSSPAKVIAPLRGRSNPIIVLRRVVLPTPLRPIRQTISPWLYSSHYQQNMAFTVVKHLSQFCSISIVGEDALAVLRLTC